MPLGRYRPIVAARAARSCAAPVGQRLHDESASSKSMPCRAGIEHRLAARQAPAATDVRLRRRQELVSGSGVPPVDETRSRARAVRRRERDRAVLGPAAAAAVRGIAQVTAAPPSTRTFFSLPSAKNAIHWPSGEKKGCVARLRSCERRRLQLVEPAKYSCGAAGPSRGERRRRRPSGESARRSRRRRRAHRRRQGRRRRSAPAPAATSRAMAAPQHERRALRAARAPSRTSAATAPQ